ncbi:hypothetical protein PR048_028823 [Dryococelus australis]|uniref:Uncharacterized protein n=1 Tax=Dryococelus australis TaxID=614101 RepID=A0ABQ9GBM0_9NEOP|nr:hypothetical protein PR048_028823 [Dryococelus australis]
MRVKRGECGAASECEYERGGRSLRGPADQWHSLARFPRAKIRDPANCGMSAIYNFLLALQVTCGYELMDSFFSPAAETFMPSVVPMGITERSRNRTIIVLVPAKSSRTANESEPLPSWRKLMGASVAPSVCPSSRQTWNADREFIELTIEIIYVTVTHYSCYSSGLETSPLRDAVGLLASHQGELGSILGRVTPGFSHMGIVPDDAAGRRVLLGDPPFLPPFHSGVSPYSPQSPSSTLKNSMLRGAKSLHSLTHVPTDMK